MRKQNNNMSYLFKVCSLSDRFGSKLKTFVTCVWYKFWWSVSYVTAVGFGKKMECIHGNSIRLFLFPQNWIYTKMTLMCFSIHIYGMVFYVTRYLFIMMLSSSLTSIFNAAFCFIHILFGRLLPFVRAYLHATIYLFNPAKPSCLSRGKRRRDARRREKRK